MKSNIPTGKAESHAEAAVCIYRAQPFAISR